MFKLINIVKLNVIHLTFSVWYACYITSPDWWKFHKSYSLISVNRCKENATSLANHRAIFMTNTLELKMRQKPKQGIDILFTPVKSHLPLSVQKL